MPLPELAQRVARANRRRAHGISYRRPPQFRRPISQACTFAQLQTPEFKVWCDRLGLPVLTHRKLWEWCYILQALTVAGMAAPGRRGVGFGVGNEPIASYVASQGARVLATDLPATASAAAGWSATGQHAARLADLNGEYHLCDDTTFAERVEFREMDMNAIADDVTGFDFTWSSCAMEHLGSLDAGLAFLDRQLQCLVPGGVGVHTTEFNVSSDDATLASGHTVLYRRRDLEALASRLHDDGHEMRVTFATGDAPEDLHVDTEPFTNVHLRTATESFVHTSFGIIIRRGP